MMKIALLVLYTNIAALLVYVAREKMLFKKKKSTNNVKNEILLDYDKYCLTMKQYVFYTIFAAVFIFLITYVFYKSLYIFLFLLPLSLLYPLKKKKALIDKRKKELKAQFRDLLYALSTSLFAGKSLEMSFYDAMKDLRIIYPNKKTLINIEVETIVTRLKMNETIEVILTDFANRAHIDEINNFVDVLVIAKRSGGNLVNVMKNTAGIIDDKMQILKEIDTILAQRRLEQKILSAMPIFMIQFITFSAKDYMMPIFESIFGRVVMTIALLLCIISYYWTKKIMNIEV